MIIYLIRHGRQNSSACNVDVELAPEGKRQAELLKERFYSTGSLYSVDAVYCSDLIRAKQTAEILFGEQPALLQNMQIRSGLNEFDFGELTGEPNATVKEFYATYYQDQMDRFAEGRIQKGSALDEVNEFVGRFFVPTEEMWYPGGESGHATMSRLMPVVEEWIESGAQKIAVVTHGGVIRVLLTTLFGGDFAKRLMFGTSLENCSITQLHFDEEKNGFFLDRFNDFAHLEAEPELMRNKFV